MSKLRLFHCVLVLVAATGLAAVSTTRAEDFVIEYPPGWSNLAHDIPPHAASATGSAVVAYRFQSDPRQIFDASIVIQARLSGATYTTEFDGKVFHVAYSLDGTRLLVHQVASSDLDPGKIAVHLLDADGNVLWTKVDTRSYFFSTSGESIFAWFNGGPDATGNSIEIFQLDGSSIATVEFKDVPVRGVTVVGDGSRAIFFADRSIVALNVASPPTPPTPPTTAWRIDLPNGYPNIASVRPLDGSRVVAKLYFRASLVINVSGGTIEYVFDPQALGDGDPLKEPRDYGSYRFFAGETSGHVILFSGTAGGKSLDLGTGALIDKGIDTSLPSREYSLGPYILEQKLFLFSPTAVIVRPV